MEEQKEYEYLLAGLLAGEQMISIGGVPAGLRNCPDRRTGEADPRSRKTALATREHFRAHKREYHRELWANEDKLFGPEDPYYYWSPDIYDNRNQDPLIDAQIREIGRTLRDSCSWYVPESADRFHPYISPVTASCENLPRTLLMTAEYDYLRAECDAYLSLLSQARVPVRAIRYGGIFHGTFDRLGYAPQVEVENLVKDKCYREVKLDLRNQLLDWIRQAEGKTPVIVEEGMKNGSL